MGFSTALVVAGGGKAVLIGFDMFAHFASTDQPTNESFNQFLNVRGGGCVICARCLVVTQIREKYRNNRALQLLQKRQKFIERA